MKSFLIFIVICITALLLWGLSLLLPAERKAANEITFEIQQGQGVKQVSRHLKKEGLIKNELAFRMLLWMQHAEDKVQAGVYRLSPSQNLLSIVERLITGTARDIDRATFIEGWTLKEYRKKIAELGFSVDEFDSLTSHTSDRTDYWFVAEIPSGQTLEGYLFPDTYALGSTVSVRPLITKMLDNFNRKMNTSMRETIEKQKKSVHEIITLASIVEKEVSSSQDRRIVADILQRRMEAGIALQSDATINYLTGSGRTRSTANDLKIDSPYNTYKYRGLPPGPIGNPGLDAIQAVINPEPNEYFYFLTDSKGNVHYAKTFEGHQENREKYL